PLLGFGGAPFFEGSHYVLHLPERLERVAARRRMELADLMREIDAGRTKLFEARAQRERPLTDDKILADWNGMAITGLAVAGKLLNEPRYVERAARAADFILRTMRPPGGPLLHSWRQGAGRIQAMLGDYVFLVRGLLALHDATGEARWLQAADELTCEQLDRLGDRQGGFFTAGVSPDILFRSKEIFDGATPGANAVAALNLLDLYARTGELSWRGHARETLRAFTQLVESHPDGARMMTVAARRYHETGAGPDEARAEYGEERAAQERTAEAAGATLEHKEERLVASRLEMGEETGGWRPFRLHLEIAPGWHLQANPAAEPYLFPTEVKAEGGELRNVRYPEGETWSPAFTKDTLKVYQGRLEITGEVSGMKRLVLTYQPCNEGACLPPVTRTLAAPG
ncbi:MAG TPA: protein-disulfide reductase DsbD domain-containing protein, partial [Thermoanaerobaculia bacterium]